MDPALKTEPVTIPPSQGPHLGRPSPRRTGAEGWGEVPGLLPTAGNPLGGLPAEPRAAGDQRPQVTHLGTLKPGSPWTPAPWSWRDPSPLVFPHRRPRSGPEHRTTGDPQASGVAHLPRTRPRSAPKRLPASRSPGSRARPESPTGTLVERGAAPYGRSRWCSQALRETTP